MLSRGVALTALVALLTGGCASRSRVWVVEPLGIHRGSIESEDRLLGGAPGDELAAEPAFSKGALERAFTEEVYVVRPGETIRPTRSLHVNPAGSKTLHSGAHRIELVSDDSVRRVFAEWAPGRVSRYLEVRGDGGLAAPKGTDAGVRTVCVDPTYRGQLTGLAVVTAERAVGEKVERASVLTDADKICFWLRRSGEAQEEAEIEVTVSNFCVPGAPLGPGVRMQPGRPRGLVCATTGSAFVRDDGPEGIGSQKNLLKPAQQLAADDAATTLTAWLPPIHAELKQAAEAARSQSRGPYAERVVPGVLAFRHPNPVRTPQGGDPLVWQQVGHYSPVPRLLPVGEGRPWAILGLAEQGGRWYSLATERLDSTRDAAYVPMDTWNGTLVYLRVSTRGWEVYQRDSPVPQRADGTIFEVQAGEKVELRRSGAEQGGRCGQLPLPSRPTVVTVHPTLLERCK